MKEKKKSAVSWILTWAGQKRIAYVWSVLLAIGNVIFKILPYFIIADVVKLFLNGEKEFKTYLAKAVLIALSFIIAELRRLHERAGREPGQGSGRVNHRTHRADLHGSCHVANCHDCRASSGMFLSTIIMTVVRCTHVIPLIVPGYVAICPLVRDFFVYGLLES